MSVLHMLKVKREWQTVESNRAASAKARSVHSLPWRTVSAHELSTLTTAYAAVTRRAQSPSLSRYVQESSGTYLAIATLATHDSTQYFSAAFAPLDPAAAFELLNSLSLLISPLFGRQPSACLLATV